MTARTPRYLQVRQALHDRVIAMRVGERLESEAQLCSEYGVARSTMRRAVDGLVQLGMVKRQQGRGSFVVSTTPRLYFPEHFTNRITGFYDQQTRAGNAVASTLTAASRRDAWPALGVALGVGTGDSVSEIKRLRYVNGRLHHYAIAYVPINARATPAHEEFRQGSLLTYIERTQHTTIRKVEVAVSVEHASAETAEALGLEMGAAVLSATSAFFDESQRPLVVSTSWFAPNSSTLTFGIALDPPGRLEDGL
jgi:GntR family transcriptional regulator